MAKPTDNPALAASRTNLDLQVLLINLRNLDDLDDYSWVGERPELGAALRNEADTVLKRLVLVKEKLDAALERLGAGVHEPE